MRIKNTTKNPDWFLRRMVGWCADRIGLRRSSIRLAEFGNRRRSFSGRAWSSMRILVRVGEVEFPKILKYPGRVHAPTLVVHDAVELLVCTTAHELQHLNQYISRSKVREAATDGVAFHVLADFRKSRESLLIEWSAAPEVKEVVKETTQQRRAAKAAGDLERWTRKLKLAQTKCRKLRARVAYYDRVAARTASGSLTPKQAVHQ